MATLRGEMMNSDRTAEEKRALKVFHKVENNRVLHLLPDTLQRAIDSAFLAGYWHGKSMRSEEQEKFRGRK